MSPKEVVDGLSVLIANAIRSWQSERHHPGPDPDKSDDEIKEQGNRIKQLRRIREEIEDLMY